ncbi:MOSC domain-containing protein, partial [Rhizobium leguminosarum]
MSADRRVPGPLFGWKVTPRGSGRITIGDPVRIVEERPEGWALKRRAAA